MPTSKRDCKLILCVSCIGDHGKIVIKFLGHMYRLQLMVAVVAVLVSGCKLLLNPALLRDPGNNIRHLFLKTSGVPLLNLDSLYI